MIGLKITSSLSLSEGVLFFIRGLLSERGVKVTFTDIIRLRNKLI